MNKYDQIYSPKKEFDIELESGQDSATLEQLRDFKPEVFESTYIQNKILSFLKSVFEERNFEIALPNDQKKSFEEYKNSLIKSILEILRSFQFEYNSIEKEVSSTNLHSSIQSRVTDIFVTNSEDLINRMSQIIESTQNVYGLVLCIDLIKKRISEIRSNILVAQEKLDHLNKDESALMERDLEITEKGNYDDKVAIKKIDTALNGVEKRKKSAKAKIAKEKKKLSITESRLETIEQLLRDVLNGKITKSEDIEYLINKSGITQIPGHDYIKNSFHNSLSESTTVVYRQFNSEAFRQLSALKRSEKVRRFVRTWGIRLFLFSLLWVPASEANELSKSKNLASLGINIRIVQSKKRKAILKVRSDDLLLYDGCNDVGFPDESCKLNWIAKLQSHPFVKNFLTEEDWNKIKLIQTSEEKTAFWKEFLKKRVTGIQFQKYLNKLITGKLSKEEGYPLIRISPDSKTKTTRFAQIHIRTEFLALIREYFGDVDIHFKLSPCKTHKPHYKGSHPNGQELEIYEGDPNKLYGDFDESWCSSDLHLKASFKLILPGKSYLKFSNVDVFEFRTVRGRVDDTCKKLGLE